MIPELSDDQLAEALGRTPGRRERQPAGEVIWFDDDRVLLADLAVPGVDARAVFDGLLDAAARVGHLRMVLDEPPVRAMVVDGALPGSRQAVAGDARAALALVLPRGFPAGVEISAARLLADALSR